jgi:fatty acid desaturase
MKNYKLAVGIVTGILILFVTLIQFEVSQFLIWLIFLAGPFLVIWMVYSVLVADVDIKETFEEQWYQDRPDMRRMEEVD